MPEAEIIPWLKARVEVSDVILHAAVKLSRGGPGKAIALAQNSNDVLRPLSQYLKSLDQSQAKIDHLIANNLAAQNASMSRALFWEALQDILRAQSVFSLTGEWLGAFKPLPVAKNVDIWAMLWDKVCEIQRAEAAINMDKKTVMLETLSNIRAA